MGSGWWVVGGVNRMGLLSCADWWLYLIAAIISNELA